MPVGHWAYIKRLLASLSSTVQDFDHGMLCRYQGYSTILFAAALGHTTYVSNLAEHGQGSLGDAAPDGSTILHLVLDSQRSNPFSMRGGRLPEDPQV